MKLVLVGVVIIGLLFGEHAYAQFPFGGPPGSGTSIWGDRDPRLNIPDPRNSSYGTYPALSKEEQEQLYGKGGYTRNGFTHYGTDRSVRFYTILTEWRLPQESNKDTSHIIWYISKDGDFKTGRATQVRDADWPGYKWGTQYDAWFFDAPPTPLSPALLLALPSIVLQQFFEKISTELLSERLQNTSGRWGLKDVWYRNERAVAEKFKQHRAMILTELARRSNKQPVTARTQEEHQEQQRLRSHIKQSDPMAHSTIKLTRQQCVGSEKNTDEQVVVEEIWGQYNWGLRKFLYTKRRTPFMVLKNIYYEKEPSVYEENPYIYTSYPLKNLKGNEPIYIMLVLPPVPPNEGSEFHFMNYEVEILSAQGSFSRTITLGKPIQREDIWEKTQK